LKDVVKDTVEQGLKDWLNGILTSRVGGVKLDQASQDVVHVAFVG